VSRIAYISGRPGAGKSTLALPLAAELGYSLVIKDLLKESLHDALHVQGERDLPWSQRLNIASWELLWTIAAHAGDMVIEANFHSQAADELNMLRGLGARLIEVNCSCPTEVAQARYNGRTRHQAHSVTLPQSAWDKYGRPIGVGPLITVDTTSPVDVAAVAAEVRRLHAS
jgi:predicted kinase